MESLFFIRFLVSSLVVSGLTVIIIFIKKIFQKHIGVEWQYRIWMIFIVMLLIPFIPNEVFNIGRLEIFNNNYHQLSENTMGNMAFLKDTSKIILQNDGGLQDFALSVSRVTMEYLNVVCFGIWFIGVAVCTLITFLHSCELRRLRATVSPIEDEEINALFAECQQELKIKRRIMLGKSRLVQTPMIFGARKVFVILPTKNINQLSIEDIRYIFLHELTHYRNKDVFMNYVICLFQIIYWFNPLIYWAFKKMRIDREVACDISVLKGLHEKQYIEYGMTIINFAELISKQASFVTTTSMGGTKTQIMNRIEKMACFKKETKITKLKSVLICTVIGCSVLIASPAISIIAYENNQYNFKETKVVYEDLSSYFQGVDGSFVLYDLQNDTYNIYNKEKSITRVSPNSTYKIYSALIGLETGIIDVRDSTRKWDGVKSPYEIWNQDQNLMSAMKNSVNWYFRGVDNAVGIDKIKYYFNQIGYGNEDFSAGIDDYWLESSLRISPVEQVELLKDFYTNDMVFNTSNINLVKESLKISERDGAVLSGKTGSGLVNKKGISGWFIGYVEKQGETFIFATNIQNEDHVSGSLAAEITLSILKDKKIYR